MSGRESIGAIDCYLFLRKGEMGKKSTNHVLKKYRSVSRVCLLVG